MKQLIRWWLVALVFSPTLAWGQEHYFVHFRDKQCIAGLLPDFAAKALARRARHGIAFPLPEDYAVDPVYVAQVKARVTQLRHVLRWPNSVSVAATAEQIAAVAELPFVRSIEPFLPLQSVVAEEAVPAPVDERKLRRLYALQRKLVGLDTLRAAGLTGKGVRIAVFDAGFRNLEDHPVFDSLWARAGVIEARDFYRRRGKNPLRYSIHGTAVLGCITGWWGDQPIGAATQAEFLLARTEYGLRENVREQDAWMAAAEWADQKGADIISSSLGYSNPLYEYAQMDGQTTRVAQAARTAIRKGILVVNSAGNQGDDDFHFIGSPADVDSVLTIGASYPMLRFPMRFSSFGPNAVGQPKPDVSGPGYVVTAGGSGLDTFTGTSFACPTVSGIAACLMQRYPNKTNMEIRQMLVESAHLYPYFDYAIGHGVVDAAQLLGAVRDTVAPTFALAFDADTLVVQFDPEVLGPDSTFDVNGLPFFFHVEGAGGKLLEYRYLRITQGLKRVGIPPARLPRGKLRIWFAGYREEWDTDDLGRIPGL